MSGSKAVTVASRSSMRMEAIKTKKRERSKEATKFKESKAKSKIANENKPSS